MKKIYSIALCLFAFGSFSAQNTTPCGTMENLDQLMKDDPALREKYEQQGNMMKNISTLVKNNPEMQTQGGLKIIPVVFHVIHVGGTENISKAQILDQLRVLNEDFRRLNSDTVNTPVPFKPLGADVNVEFRMAQLDNNGVCTDGIVRKYSPLSVNAANNVKALSYWPSTKYFNIWVVKSIDGATPPNYILGYAQFPAMGPATTDGVVIRHDVCGTIGTAATGPFPGNNGRTLVHEAGHWLGLRHIWGDATCGNDNCADTPEHIDANSGCPSFPYNANNSCSPSCGPNGEMYPNYMDYTDGQCQNLFTIGQAAIVNTVLTTIRTNIWSNANLIATGTDGTPAVVCAPKADIFPHVAKMICAGDNVTFKDASYNGQVTGRSWTFQGGNPSTSTDSTEVVTYSTPGTYSVALTVTNSAGTATATKTNWVIVSPTTADYSIWNFYEGFDGGNIPSNWRVFNLGGDPTTWAYTTAADWFGGASVRIANVASIYGQVDELISPSVNLTVINAPKIYYYVAYTQRDANDEDKLRVLVSTDCGDAWTQRTSKIGSTLATSSTQITNFIPTQPTQWRLETVSLSSYTGVTNLRVKWEFTSDGGNYIYIDNVNISGTLGEEEIVNNPFDLQLFPNPVIGYSTLIFDAGGSSALKITVKDLMGRELKVLADANFSGENQITFDSGEFSKGVYFLTLEHEGKTYVKKFVVH